MLRINPEINDKRAIFVLCFISKSEQLKYPEDPFFNDRVYFNYIIGRKNMLTLFRIIAHSDT